MKKETRLKRIINNESKDTLSRKLNTYFLYGSFSIKTLTDDYSFDQLKELKDLVQKLQIITGHYKFNVLYDNDKYFWDNNFDNAADAIAAASEKFSLNDKYVFINENTGLVDSWPNFAGFYTNARIKKVAAQIAADLKENTTELIDKLNSDNQEVLLKALNN